MQQRLPSLLNPPILFAHRGARAVAPENTIEAFQTALRLGATGLESDVWVTADGIPVLDHDGAIKSGLLSRRPIGELRRSELPSHIPALVDLIETCGIDYDLSLDVKDAAAGPTTIAVVREAAPDLIARMWLCHHELDELTRLRSLDDTVRLVDSTRLKHIDEGAEVRAATLRSLGIDAINMRQPDWNGGLVALFHRFDRVTFSWDNQHDHELRSTLRMGLDGVYSDYVDRMVDAFNAEIGPAV